MATSPKLYLIITNISKANNIRSLLTAAAAYGCENVFIAGQPNFSLDPTNGDVPHKLRAAMNNGSIRIQRFPSLDDCVSHIHELGNIKIVGVEIMDESVDINEEPFPPGKHIALMMGNEGSGMNKKQIDACDNFIRIAQYGGGTASLNVNVAANIVMRRFHIWARKNRMG